MFGCARPEELRAVIRYIKSRGGVFDHYNVAVFEAEPTFKGDMKWLRFGSPVKMWSDAVEYWSGAPVDDDPLWEHMFSPPCEVKELRGKETIQNLDAKGS